MFETAEIGRTLSKQAFEAALPELRTRLLQAQTKLERAGFPVIVLLNGADAAGKGDTLNVLHEWLDARYLSTFAYAPPSEEERERPEFWRFWMALPPSGRVGLFLGNWYSRPILQRVHGTIDDGELSLELAKINAFERTLVDGGTLICKLWFHIGQKQQRKRLERLESSKRTRWRVSEQDWKHHELYDDFVACAEGALRETSTGEAPWQVIESTDDRYRNFTAAQHLLAQLEHRLSGESAPHIAHPEPAITDPTTILDNLELSHSVSKDEYEERLPLLQGRLNKLARRLAKKRRSAIFVFEGSDAAGKGGAIRRIAWALDARQYRVIPIAAPTDEERAHL